MGEQLESELLSLNPGAVGWMGATVATGMRKSSSIKSGSFHWGNKVKYFKTALETLVLKEIRTEIEEIDDWNLKIPQLQT